MAVNDMPAPFDSSPDDTIEPIDPNETPEPFDLHPKWGALDAIDAAQIVLSYDRRSDSLIVHFFERGAPYVAVESGEWTYLLVDPETELVTTMSPVPAAIMYFNAAWIVRTTPPTLVSMRRSNCGTSFATKSPPP